VDGEYFAIHKPQLASISHKCHIFVLVASHLQQYDSGKIFSPPQSQLNDIHPDAKFHILPANSIDLFHSHRSDDYYDNGSPHFDRKFGVLPSNSIDLIHANEALHDHEKDCGYDDDVVGKKRQPHVADEESDENTAGQFMNEEFKASNEPKNDNGENVIIYEEDDTTGNQFRLLCFCRLD
jgi:hypothetical protein